MPPLCRGQDKLIPIWKPLGRDECRLYHSAKVAIVGTVRIACASSIMLLYPIHNSVCGFIPKANFPHRITVVRKTGFLNIQSCSSLSRFISSLGNHFLSLLEPTSIVINYLIFICVSQGIALCICRHFRVPPWAVQFEGKWRKLRL
jgi:hypothetical protein